jgi:hypothetical protein
MNEIIKQLKAYALEHYEEGGWDYLVECYEDKDILEMIEGCTTYEEALAKVKRIMKIKDDVRKDVEAEIF